MEQPSTTLIKDELDPSPDSAVGLTPDSGAGLTSDSAVSLINDATLTQEPPPSIMQQDSPSDAQDRLLGELSSHPATIETQGVSSERMRKLDALKSAEAQMVSKGFINVSPDGAINIIDLNDAAAKVVGAIAPTDTTGLAGFCVQNGWTLEHMGRDIETIIRESSRKLRPGDTFEMKLHTSNGLVTALNTLLDTEGNIAVRFEQAQLEKDQLTGLPNRTALSEAIHECEWALSENKRLSDQGLENMRSNVPADIARSSAVQAETNLVGGVVQEEQRVLELSPQNPLGVLMFDANNLKKINDSLGHTAGDAYILTIVSAISAAIYGPEQLSSNDALTNFIKAHTEYGPVFEAFMQPEFWEGLPKNILEKRAYSGISSLLEGIFRYGGDEFVALVDGYSQEQLSGICSLIDRAIEIVNTQFDKIQGDKPPALSVSFGCIVTDGVKLNKIEKREDGEYGVDLETSEYISIQETIDTADALMYEYKKSLKREEAEVAR